MVGREPICVCVALLIQEPQLPKARYLWRLHLCVSLHSGAERMIRDLKPNVDIDYQKNSSEEQLPLRVTGECA